MLGAKKKVEALEEELLKERKRWTEACRRDNAILHKVREENTNLKAQAEILEKRELLALLNEAKFRRERTEQQHVETKVASILKDNEIWDLTASLFEQDETKERLAA
ncbi:hypothetical protein HanIR_Chr12g0613621 [Helianthus annuus]|nr:hypothetical protein HanIR_Chr12g0613621 [Helianthus annuus]